MSTIESCRARRRRITDTVAHRRHSEYVNLWLDGDPFSSRWAALSHRYWAKVGTCCCACSKRLGGSPKVSKGMCNVGDRDRIYRLRASALELNRLIHQGHDLDGDWVAALSATRVYER